MAETSYRYTWKSKIMSPLAWHNQCKPSLIPPASCSLPFHIPSPLLSPSPQLLLGLSIPQLIEQKRNSFSVKKDSGQSKKKKKVKRKPH